MKCGLRWENYWEVQMFYREYKEELEELLDVE